MMALAHQVRAAAALGQLCASPPSTYTVHEHASHAVLPTRVELAAKVSRLGVDLCLVDETSHHVRLAVKEELHAHNRALRHDAWHSGASSNFPASSDVRARAQSPQAPGTRP